MFRSITVQSAAENASPLTLAFVILLSFILSTILAFVYQKNPKQMTMEYLAQSL